jgi:hypothetical protein
MIQVQINEANPKSFSNEESLNIVNSIDYSMLSNGNYSVIKNNKSYEIAIQNINKEEKTIEIN